MRRDEWANNIMETINYPKDEEVKIDIDEAAYDDNHSSCCDANIINTFFCSECKEPCK